MEKNSDEKELEDVLDLFISSGQEKEQEVAEGFPSNPYTGAIGKPNCDIEETVTVKRKMGFSESREAQDEIKKVLFDYLGQQYSISQIILKKTVDIIEPGRREKRNEEIIIFVKEKQGE